MSRLPRFQAINAMYHITSRGNRRALLYLDEADHLEWLEMLAETSARYNIVVYAYCMMPNHFHLLLQTREPNIGNTMRYLNGSYGRYFNQRHELTGHALQGRYHSEVIHSDAQLLETARYNVLNPVRANLAANAIDWPWSSHRCALGIQTPPKWLDCEWLLGMFGNGSMIERAKAYDRFVIAGKELPRPSPQLALPMPEAGRPRPSLINFEQDSISRNAAIYRAHMSGEFTLRQIAQHFCISPRTACRVIQAMACKYHID